MKNFNQADTDVIKAKRLREHEESFNRLMQKRIYRILIICSNYDYYMLEEDGRIDEQIFNEYVSLNLRYPPVFTQADTAEKAYEKLETEDIDLVITSLNIGRNDAFQLSKDLKAIYPDIPIVVLTHFSREVRMRIANEDLSAIDYVFCWLGHASILLAIIKLIEDKMNIENDVKEVGVQAILLVEDSIRFYSSYLPIIYRICFEQARIFMSEGLNEHKSILRQRGRPKILLATNFEEAIELYNKYKTNLLGIISDISYKRNGEKDPQAGIRLSQMVKAENPYFPLLLQSSDEEFEKVAKQIKVGFINKNSKTILHEIRDFILKYFAFGDFVFTDPDTGEEVARGKDLKSLQRQILRVPDKVLLYHIERNHISKWLKARALFPLAELFAEATINDFESLDAIRQYIYQETSIFRLNKGRGVIAKFDRNRFDDYLSFSRIGEGSLGGKARGLAFIDSFLIRHDLFNKYKNIVIKIPRTVVLSTDIFDEFMESNKLYNIALSEVSDQEILDAFIKAELPAHIYKDLQVFITFIKNPIAIRSSSVLEDSHYQPFAGIYSTYMIPKIDSDPRLMMQMLEQAIKSVYASVFYKSSKAYMKVTSNLIDEEKMGIILQEVCGTRYKNKFYPTFSGVARSVNFYPIEEEKPEEGIANIAFGLGKIIVDGGKTLRFSPCYPRKVLQLSSPQMALGDTQKYFYALDLSAESFKPSLDEGVNLLKLPIREAEKDNALKYVASTYDFQNQVIRDGVNYDGKKIITFANILSHGTFPLPNILKDLLQIGQKEMNNPIEIEFAVNLDTPPGCPKEFSFLQIRPIVESTEDELVDIDNVKNNETIITSNSALGNGTIRNICDFVYVKPETFNAADSPKMALAIEALNEKFLNAKQNYILVGPGRWGSSDPWLGIPVKWSQISAARLIVESGLNNYRIDPSQGTHFFQNLTSFRVAYFTINPYINDGWYDIDYLNKIPSIYEDKYLRHIRFSKPVLIKVNGSKNKGVVFKEQED